MPARYNTNWKLLNVCNTIRQEMGKILAYSQVIPTGSRKWKQFPSRRNKDKGLCQRREGTFLRNMNSKVKWINYGTRSKLRTKIKWVQVSSTSYENPSIKHEKPPFMLLLGVVQETPKIIKVLLLSLVHVQKLKAGPYCWRHHTFQTQNLEDPSCV